MTRRTHFTVVLLIVCSALGACTGKPDPRLISQAVRDGCSDHKATEAAALARQAFPDTLPASDRGLARNEFIRRNRWKLFASAGATGLTSDEFLSAKWAGFLAQLPAGRCVVTERDFMDRFLGDPSDPRSGWKVPYQPYVYRGLFQSLDKDQKGFLTKADIRGWVGAAFGHADQNRDGLVSQDELTRPAHRRSDTDR